MTAQLLPAYICAAIVAVTLFSIADSSNAIHAAPDAAQSDAFAETIRRSIIKSIGAQENTVAVGPKGDIFTVARTNSNMNESNHEVRNNEALIAASRRGLLNSCRCPCAARLSI